MQNQWDEAAAAQFDGPVGFCVYGSRLIGSDSDLVLHGGGNTSVKAGYPDITGSEVPALYVKGSGWDLATIEVPGFTPLRLSRLAELLDLERLSDPDMMRELSAARLDPNAPQPSVESLLHAFLPFPAVQHSHADVVVTLTNLADGRARVDEVFGDDVVVIPYVMPGFDLAKVVATLWPQQAHTRTIGMVLMNHGLFTFGDTTRIAYERHVELINRAETWLDAQAPATDPGDDRLGDVSPTELAALRSEISRAAGKPMIMTRQVDPQSTRFVSRPDLADLASRGPLTPDHVIRTKRHPMIGTDVSAYVQTYQRYFEDNQQRVGRELTMLDPAPRVVVDPGFGLLTIGETAKAASIANDIYQHSMPVFERSEDHLGGYQALPASDFFDAEYWELEQAKLRRPGATPEFAGHVALVTGAASGIGKACAAELLSRGAAVVGFDRDPSIVSTFEGHAWLGVTVDITDEQAQSEAVATAVGRYGGIDILVAAAGVFGDSAPIAQIESRNWRFVQAVNLEAVVALMSLVHPLMAQSPVGGRVVFIGSKNVPAPGKGAASYSASKAALTQLARIAALEWAEDSIRVNTVHPDGVFDTGLWTEELLAERAAKYEMSVEQYKARNLLSIEITSHSVALLVAQMCGAAFAATTGSQVPIDGGSERVI